MSIFTSRFKSLYVSLLIIPFLLTIGCGSSSDKSFVEQYPTLAKEAQLDNHEFEVFLNGINANADVNFLTPDSVKNLTIGSKLNSRDSSFLVNPIFDIGGIAQDNKLDKNLSSSTVTVSELKMTSRQNASQESGQFSESVSGSFSYGFFKASVAQNYSNKYQTTLSTGSVYIDMSQNTQGAYIELLTGYFDRNADFSKFLLGTKLDANTVKSYVDYVESTVPGSADKYISSLKITNKGQLSDLDNVYGNIQLLSEMERLFGLMRTQYDKYTNQSVRDQLLKNMRELRVYISLAIRNFYSVHGDSFVSKVNLMNYAYGTGELKFTNESGNQETQWGVAVSASYQGAKAGGGASTMIQQARQSGWASAIKNVQVMAKSFPSGVVDTNQWVSTINDMLSKEQAISVPPLNLPALAEMKIPDPIGPQKEPQPPDNCFNNVQEWEDYQNRKKQQGQQQDQKQAQEGQQQIDQQGVQQDDPPPGVNSNLYKAYRKELTEFNKRFSKRGTKSLKAGDNIIRVDKMFVSGFRATPYDSMIPQLRPNLEIPGESKDLSGYPNVAKLIYIVNILGDLDTYLRFLSNYTVSGVSKQMSSNYKTFYDTFYNEAYDKIAFQLSNGVDISNDLLSSFKAHHFGVKGDERNSTLYQKMGDIDAYNYILNVLLKPENVKIWRTASGGYIPFGWDTNSTVSFLNPKQIGKTTFQATNLQTYYFDHDKYPFTDPQKNLIDFYDSPIYKTPWYPVFQYSGSRTPNLLFLQSLGGYQLAVGLKYASFAAPNGWNWYVILPFNQTNPRFKVIQLPSALTDSLRDADNSLANRVNWNYSISFPNTSPDPTRIDKFNVLTVVLDKDFGVSPTSPGGWYYLLNPSLVLKEYFDGWQSGGAKNVIDVSSKTVVDLKSRYPSAKAVFLLLPINKKTIGDSYNNTYSYATNFNATDIINSDTFKSSYKLTLFNY